MFKLMRKRNKQGQTTLEYAVLIIIIIGALIAIQVYIKRGIQGRMKQAADDIGSQYSPGNTNVVKTTVTSGKTKETFGIDAIGVTRSELLNTEITNITLTQNIVNSQQEYWGSERQ